jgi:AcrR family transcriptional regulator
MLTDTVAYQLVIRSAIRYRIKIAGNIFEAPLNHSTPGEYASQDWVTAGLAELALNGISGVRVEVLAERMGITKGGFYRRFRDRRELLDAMLQAWIDGRTEAIERHAETGGGTALERLRAMIKLYTERASAQGMAIELAIRQWARTDEAAAAAAAKVDAVRLRTVARLYRELGLSPSDAEGRATLFYSFLFGQSLLFDSGSPRKRASLVATCMRTLTDVDVKP